MVLRSYTSRILMAATLAGSTLLDLGDGHTVLLFGVSLDQASDGLLIG